ncbi:type II secretion system F family protein [Bryobacter aggregatus]|uniref:type II secretion system F family protein n=1 Tax=Bryobacter aggregatus TaxID=360054 RepID=UPI0004E13B1C|nr:type II secretion system F family protein [Bryobacter aggregatus]
MTTFQFRAVTSDGKARSGSYTAASEKLVAIELRRQGLTPTYIGLEKPSGFELKLPEFGGKKRRDVLFFTQELATLLSSSVPVDRALSIVSELTERQEFRSVVLDILRMLKGGKSLADSIATHPSYFSELYINMVRAGEASGSLATVFQRLSHFERNRDELRGYIISSMMYPLLLGLTGLGAIVVLMYFVVPRFATIFEGGRMQIPLPTLIMLRTSEFLQAWGWLLGIVVAAALVSFLSYIGTKDGRWWWDDFRLRIPLLGDALRKAETARFARAMSTLVSNTVPLVQSLQIAGGTLANLRMARSLETVAQGVKRGEGISVPLRRSGQFPPLASHLLSVGEETGKLDEMFTRMADIYEADTRDAVKRFTSLFEPLLILTMGIIVGALILSMLLAITSINEVAI